MTFLATSRRRWLATLAVSGASLEWLFYSFEPASTPAFETS
jgi:hypothetical protein